MISHSAVVQLVERRAHIPEVAGSIPVSATNLPARRLEATGGKPLEPHKSGGFLLLSS